MTDAEKQAEVLLPDNLFAFDDHKREARYVVAAALAEKDEQINIGLQISGSFFEALKPLGESE